MMPWVWILAGASLLLLAALGIWWWRSMGRASPKAAAIDRLFNQHRDALGDNFGLNLGSRYRVPGNRAPLEEGSVVLLRCTH